MSYMDDCFAGAPQDFLICITVHKAAKVGLATSELYVKVILDKTSKSTKTFPNSENPFFNEYFVFEFRCTLTDLLRMTILFELKKTQTLVRNVVVGELLIDLHSVWNQPNHGFFKKWGRLEPPVGENPASDEASILHHGYLQIDLVIVSQHSSLVNSNPNSNEEPDTQSLNKWTVDQDYDDIEKNLLLNPNSYTPSNIRYTIAFYRGFFVRKGSYMIQYRFHPFTGKTPVAKQTATPVWNHEISFAWMYPSLAQRFLILVLVHEHIKWKCVAEYELSFEEIAFKSIPSLGPTYLHLYDPANALTYVGRILLELRSEDVAEERPSHVILSEDIHGLDESRFWKEEIFMVEFLPLLGDHIQSSASSYKISMKLAENTSTVVEGPLKTPAGKFRSAMHSKSFRQDAPYRSCILRARLPDNRDKYESDYFMIDLIGFMRSELDTFKVFQLKSPQQDVNQAKCLKAIISSILNKIKEGIKEHRFDHEMENQRTPWDINRQLFLVEFFAKLPQELRLLKQELRHCFVENLDASVADVANELHRVVDRITALSNMTRQQDEWPDLLLFLSAGGKEVGVCRLNAKHFLHLHRRELQQNQFTQCWRLKSFAFKALGCIHSCPNCGCSTAMILGCMGIVVERERKQFLSQNIGDWVSIEPMVWKTRVARTFFRCHVYIHQAKVRPSGEKKHVADSHLRILFGEQAAETDTSPGTLSPIWDAEIIFKCMNLPGSVDWYVQNPPLLSLEFYNKEKSLADELVGKGHLMASVISGNQFADSAWEEGPLGWSKGPLYKLQRLKHVSPPPLKWVPLARKGAVQAEVLMSAEFIELPDGVIDGSKEPVLTTGIPQAIRPNVLNFVLEVVFVGLRNYSKSTMSGAGKRKIKIMMGDQVLTSGPSTARIGNSINFLVAYASAVVSLPDQQEYWPAIIAADVLISGLTTESVLGAALIPNSGSFLQRGKTAKCGTQSLAASTTTATTALSVDEDDNTGIESSVEVEDTEMEYSDEEEDEEESPAKLSRLWRRLLFALGLRPAAYANRLALRYGSEDMDHSDLISEGQFTWWTKFYNSMYWKAAEMTHEYKHRLVIFPNELEKQPQFGYLQDWAVPVQMVHGVKFKKQAPPKEDAYATLKIQIKLTPCQCGARDEGGGGDMIRPLAAATNPRHQTLLQSLAEPVRLAVRVYVVQGLQMRPRDVHDDSDCYVKLLLGGRTLSDRAAYIPNQSNPIFGRIFEMEATLPGDSMLLMMVYDQDKFRDDIIGQTYIDLEDRWRSKHRATVGLAQEYSRAGYNQWHDVSLPSEILKNLCQQRGIQPPYYYGNVVEVDGLLFGDETTIARGEELHERLSLTVLKNIEKLPSFGYKLVPEHVETRSLYRDDYPNVEQGKLQLWLELFEANTYIPFPVDITPVPPAAYEIRVVVKNLRGIQAGDRNVFGKLMSDLFVTGWCQDIDKRQSTDIHYRSFTGDAAFNWRMIFPMMYSPNEDMMVFRRRGGLFEEIEIKRPPVVYLQIWDRDMIKRNDYLGSLELNLSNMPMPYETERQCRAYANQRQRLNLFHRRSIQGWFPVESAKPKSGLPVTSTNGKMELEIDVCTSVQASNQPAGHGHDPPMALERPNRPNTAFNPLTHPFKSFQYSLWPSIRKYVLWSVLVIIVIMGLVLYIFEIPSKLMAIPLL
ncbi:fer-1-like protein 6 [Drosophila guanche]|uniref:Blast:Fer-1-like protein 6 n=1 Tax=Drosophila guanche TaxID=7266 RepID=A0A3B0JPE0_DROGU|nr:fer-1-like protein 6 [Drosophila guanche]SPP77350.1 blast:Fer-1-like protein 6 [Drosophila guanche]